VGFGIEPQITVERHVALQRRAVRPNQL
jgi:hypothetical protein